MAIKVSQITTRKEFCEFERQSSLLELKTAEPEKGWDFYLFRGVKKSCYQLVPSLVRYVRDTKFTIRAREHAGLARGDQWESQIADVERALLDRLLAEEKALADFEKQYRWFNPPNPKTDTFWYLSLMQHHGCPTRLVDFTADFWTAIFFAVHDAETGASPAVYRLKCTNENEKDSGGNKLPRDCNGDPHRNANGVDMNQLLGRIIGYGGFAHEKINLDTDQNWKSRSAPAQHFGWDRPAMKTARLAQQRGFFVYNLDVRRTLHEELDARDNVELVEFVFGSDIVSHLKKRLEEKRYSESSVYLDLDKRFEEWLTGVLQS
ncbi:MAG: FRG domain-containing protein [Opitutae bacterium]|nr:FRG domain-containing protein [Opitutae bacterium]